MNALHSISLEEPERESMLSPIDPAEAVARIAHRLDVDDLLIAMQARLNRIFSIQNPNAPGLHLVGGLLGLPPEFRAAFDADSCSVTGNGVLLSDALVACLGEAAEMWSQFEQAGDVAVSDKPLGNAAGWISQVMPASIAGMGWVCGENPWTLDDAWLPADLVLRRNPLHRKISPVGALSSGVAAGATMASAKQRAILELIERDAAAMWWLGGRKPAGLDPASMAYYETMAMLDRLRGDTAERTSVILDITSDIGVPVIAACSWDADGRGFAAGVAARMSVVDAADAALREMGQMELAAVVARQKAIESGEAALNKADLGHIARSDFDAGACPLLWPGRPRATAVRPSNMSVLDIVQEHALGLTLVNLSRPEIGVPVIRAVSPDLQPYSEMVTTPRLAQAQAQWGGGAAFHKGARLF